MEGDEALLFGREIEIRNALKALELLRDSVCERALIIQAPSGAGKSSLLRAGLWPRLRNHAGFTPLGIVRAAKGIVRNEEWGLITALNDRRTNYLKLARDEIESRVRDDLAALLAAIADKDRTEDGGRRTLLLGLDQAEEIAALSPEEDTELDDLLVRDNPATMSVWQTVVRALGDIRHGASCYGSSPIYWKISCASYCVAAAGLLAGTTICASIYGRFQSDADFDALLGMSAAAQVGGVLTYFVTHIFDLSAVVHGGCRHGTIPRSRRIGAAESRPSRCIAVSKSPAAAFTQPRCFPHEAQRSAKRFGPRPSPTMPCRSQHGFRRSQLRSSRRRNPTIVRGAAGRRRANRRSIAARAD
jgi:hypothetical protein